MSCLSIEELDEQERREIAEARALMDPYIAISKVEWLKTEENA